MYEPLIPPPNANLAKIVRWLFSELLRISEEITSLKTALEELEDNTSETGPIIEEG